MRYGIWNNKGGVGKTFLSFVLATQYAKNNPTTKVIVVDMCPQANLSEILLGGNGNGAGYLKALIDARQTIGGYFNERILSPHVLTGRESQYQLRVADINNNIPDNLWLIAGDPCLELQAQVINQISALILPTFAWKSVHNWLLDMILVCLETPEGNGDQTTVFIDCNPSFSAYTEIAVIASERLIIPCSSDGSSARAIDNIASLVYGMGSQIYSGGFAQKAESFAMPLPQIHSVVLNRSTQHNKRASKAFGAIFREIQNRVNAIKDNAPHHFVPTEKLFWEIPDNHSVAIVCSHLGMPLYAVEPRKYPVHDQTPQVNDDQLERYKSNVMQFLGAMQRSEQGGNVCA